ncbi:MAG TPA: hypothetical protein VNE62_09350 [Actinomycetota bacterium]|nr:hypothetical protein [Actinomycetota bacterium]
MRKLLIAVALTGGVALAAPVAPAAGEPGPNGNNTHGLCTAYFNGSETGQANKRKAPPFQGLERAAEANDQTVAEYCEGLVGGKPSRRA